MQFHYLYSILDIIDGRWGGIVNRTTNAFNGMIGMIQRRVSFLFEECSTAW
jgi:hypothetical protein